MNINTWKQETDLLLADLREIDFGYPLGENVIFSPSPVNVESWHLGLMLSDRAALALRAFYEVCDGLSWPDVQNGYYIQKSEVLGRVANQHSITKVKTDITFDVITIGSTGGGTTFVMNFEGHIIRLPRGRVEDNTYCSSESQVDLIAEDLFVFLERLSEDLAAFVEDREGYSYL